MFNGRNRFNGFTTGKPVCVLRLDSAGTEVKRKNRALEIPHKLLIIKAFLPLTEPKTAVLKGLFGRCQTALYLPNIRRSPEPHQNRIRHHPASARARVEKNGRRSNHLRASKLALSRPASRNEGTTAVSPSGLWPFRRAETTFVPPLAERYGLDLPSQAGIESVW
jgi:hypothetical protein